MITKKIVISGKVQGVGFRPFIFRLAHQHGITGWIRNSNGQVDIRAQGTEPGLQQFETDILEQHPPLATPHIDEAAICDSEVFTQFDILKSGGEQPADIHIPADFFTCNECLKELMDPADRRYRYPFINCTNCGPRYTLIKKLPYDRPNTSMAEFDLCSPCLDEYSNPYDRRFHAQPLACDSCGPQLHFHSGKILTQGNAASLAACVEALQQGKIIAVKGIGGYHLMCDARNQQAVQTLRDRKHRPDKPFAVLFPWQGDNGTEHAEQYLQASDEELAQLRHPSRAVVLITGNNRGALADNINPGLGEIGAMLPYSPLHHLISHDFGAPLVATSANFSGEPVITENDDAESRLSGIVDGFLHHNRPILRPADDTVLRLVHGQAQLTRQFIRLGRGCAPLELELPFELDKPLLAVGGHMKNTIALAWKRRLVISPHIGDLSSPRSMAVFEQVIEDLQALYEVYPQHVVCDRHPEYASHRWARRYCEDQVYQLLPVFHHHAHASTLCGEYPDETRWLVFTWDGTGYGVDGNIWGGEALLGQPANWQRVMSFKPLSILGGDRAALQPWRSAAAMCWAQDIDWQPREIDAPFARQAWQKRQGCFESSAAGRLFDAAAALILDTLHCSFDGQAPMLLEQVAEPLSDQGMELPIQESGAGLHQVDWSPLVPMLLDNQLSKARRSSLFHSSMAMSLLKQAEKIRELYGDFCVGLGGGVFQNRKLTEHVIQLLQAHDFRVYINRDIPCNDAGISYGQIIEAQQALHS